MSSFRRFQQWYVDHLSEIEIEDALRTIISGASAPKKGRPVRSIDDMSPEQKRETLVHLWRRRPTDVAVGAFFSKFHVDASAAIQPMLVHDINDSIPDLITKFGVRGSVFALLVNSSDYHKEVGYRLMADFPPPERKAEEIDADKSAAPEGSDLPSASTPDGSIDAAALFATFAALLDSLEQYGDAVNPEQLVPFVQKFHQVWDQIRTGQARNKLVREKIEQATKAILDEYDAEQLAYWEVHQTILDISASSDRWRVHAIGPVVDQLGRLRALIADGEALRQRSGSAPSARELSSILEQLQTTTSFIEEIRQSLKKLLSEATLTAVVDVEHSDTDESAFRDSAPVDAEDTPSLTTDPSVASGRSDGTEPLATESTMAAAGPQDSKSAEAGGTPTETEASPTSLLEPTTDETPLAPQGTDKAPASPATTVKPKAVEAPPTAPKLRETVAPEPPGVEAQLVIDAIASGDFSSAYWLTRELEVQEDKQIEGLPPSWSLLALTIGATDDWSKTDLIKHWISVSQHHPKAFTELGADRALSQKSRAYLIGLAALRPTLFAPETGATDWLHDIREGLSDPADPFRDLLGAITKFSVRGRALELDLLAADDRAPWRERLQDAREQLAQWRLEMKASRSLYAMASRVSTQLAVDEGPLTELFRAMESEDMGPAEARQLVLDHLGNRADMSTLINDCIRSVATRRGKLPDIVGRPHRHLMARLERLREIGDEWVDALRTRDSSRDDWYISWIGDLRSNFLAHWDDLQATWSANRSQQSSPMEEALRLALHRSLSSLVEQVRNPKKSDAHTTYRSWKAALRRPLLALDAPPLDDEGNPILDDRPWDESLLQLRLQGEVDWRAVFAKHLEHNQFFNADLVLAELRVDGDDDPVLADNLRIAWHTASGRLERQLARTREIVEQSYIEHVLSEAQRSKIDASLLGIESSIDEGQGDGVEYRNLAADFGELESIVGTIRKTRFTRVQSLQASIEEYMAESADLVEKALEFIQLAKEALDQGDIPVADEYISYAELAQTGADASAFDPPAFDNVVPEFANALEDITTTLQRAQDERTPRAVMQALADGRSVPGISMRLVPGSRQSEVKRGLEAYYSLKSRRRLNDSIRLVRDMQRLLEYIGFHVNSVQLKERGGGESLHFTARMSAGTQSPLAEFGSLRRGHYDIVLFYGRPTATMMAEDLRRFHVTANYPIIIRADRMSSLQREEWSSYCWEHRLTAMLLDEVLLHYVAGQRETRLPAAVSCGVAWGYCSPYRSFGDIPLELFKGRHALVSDIAGRRRTGVVYGGRQFGKTALLRTAARLVHRPEERTFVIFEDIKHLGHPTGMHQPELLWPRLRDRLAEHGIVSKSVRNGDKIVEAIVAAAKADPKLRIIFLLDEADNFLDKDAADGYPELEKIRTLQERTEDQVKVVLSGLHNVQRHYKDINHPLAQLGGSISIGPLPARGARSLIEEPLSALGFTFGGNSTTEDEDAERIVLRILSYTNYHPALIQHFCGELIHLVRQTRTSPPYRITMADVEAVYRKPEVQSMMKERFEWTIGLDNRYKVIVYSMISAQLDDNNGFRKTFTAREIDVDVKMWWPQGFAEVPMDEVQGLLDELIGLGVLVRLDDGSYRLRNGNVVRALGTPDEIYARLTAACDESPETREDPGRFRLQLSRQRRSPLVVRQLRTLTEPRSGVAVVFGSDALLQGQVEESIEQYVKSIVTQTVNARVHTMPLDCVTGEHLLRYVERLYEERLHHIVFCPKDHLLLTTADFRPALKELVARLSAMRSRQKSVRIVFLLGPAETVHWFRQLGDSHAEMEQQLTPITISLWDNAAVQRFFQDDNPGLPVTLNKVMDATGGWPYLLEKLQRTVEANTGQAQTTAIETIIARLENMATNDDGIREEFAQALGINAVPLAKNMLRFVMDDLGGAVSLTDAIDFISISDDPALQQASRDELLVTFHTLTRLHLLRDTQAGLIVDKVVARAIADAGSDG